MWLTVRCQSWQRVSTDSTSQSGEVGLSSSQTSVTFRSVCSSNIVMESASSFISSTSSCSLSSWFYLVLHISPHHLNPDYGTVFSRIWKRRTYCTINSGSPKWPTLLLIWASGSADRMALFLFTSNPSWRQAAILDNFEWPYLCNDSFDPPIFAIAQLSCFILWLCELD